MDKDHNKRVWSLYNESLVRRMKDILDLKDIENYRDDLGNRAARRMEGRSSFRPDKIIEVLARIRPVFNASFRPLESYMRIFQEILGIPRISYTSIFSHTHPYSWRIRRIKVAEIFHPCASVAIDSTDFETTIRGNWLSNKWAKKREGWIKLHVSADADRIMASRTSITTEKIHDASQFSNLITGSERRVFADKAYDSSPGGYSMHLRIMALRPLSH